MREVTLCKSLPVSEKLAFANTPISQGTNSVAGHALHGWALSDITLNIPHNQHDNTARESVENDILRHLFIG